MTRDKRRPLTIGDIQDEANRRWEAQRDHQAENANRAFRKATEGLSILKTHDAATVRQAVKPEQYELFLSSVNEYITCLEALRDAARNPRPQLLK